MPTDVIPANGRQLQFKDDAGLTLQQRNLLQELAMVPNWREACANAEVSPPVCQKWLRNSPEFREAYNNLIGPALDLVQDKVETMAHEATDIYEDAMKAVHYFSKDVSCPKCSHEFSTPIGGPDWNARLRAGDRILQISRILIDRKQIQQTTVTMTMEQSMALMQYKWARKNGKTVLAKPSLIDDLRRMGEIE